MRAESSAGLREDEIARWRYRQSVSWNSVSTDNCHKDRRSGVRRDLLILVWQQFGRTRTHRQHTVFGGMRELRWPNGRWNVSRTAVTAPWKFGFGQLDQRNNHLCYGSVRAPGVARLRSTSRLLVTIDLRLSGTHSHPKGVWLGSVTKLPVEHYVEHAPTQRIQLASDSNHNRRRCGRGRAWLRLDGDGKGLRFNTCWKWWLDHSCAAMGVRPEETSRNRRSACRNQPQFVSFLRRQLGHVAGQEHECSSIALVNCLALRLWRTLAGDQSEVRGVSWGQGCDELFRLNHLLLLCREIDFELRYPTVQIYISQR